MTPTSPKQGERKSIKSRILCFIGYHSWKWTLKREGNITEPLTGKIPDRAICCHCGIKYN